MAKNYLQQKWWLPVLAVLAVLIVIAWRFWFADTGKGKPTTVTNTVPTAQAPKAREPGVQTFWYDPPHQLQKKMVIRCEENRPLPTGGNVLFTGLTVDTFQETGAAGLTMEASECVFNLSEFSGTSPGPLKVRTADGNSFIEGTGYLWTYQGSNLTVTISNHVSTTLKRDFLTSGTNQPAQPIAATNLFVTIHADKVFMDRASNLITYTGHVHAEDERWDLTCEVLTISGATIGTTAGSTNMLAGGKIGEMVADQKVVILDKATDGRGRATGDRAVYRAVDGAVVLSLTGDPHWESGPSQATAQAFIFEGSANILRAVGDANFKLPSSSLNKSGSVLLAQPAGGANASNTNVSLMDITAGSITLELPATNGAPLRGVIAETNVLMTDEDNQSRASADRAVYTQTNGLTELIGHASWQMRRRLARGGLLTFNQNENTFSARTNAYLQFPPNEFGQANAVGGLLATNAGRTTNQLVRVSADAYDYQNETLTFSNHVQGAYLEDEIVRDTLESGVLTIGFLNTNVVRDLTASGGAHLRQLPAPDAHGQTEEGDFQSDRLQIQMRTNGLVELVTATGGVTAKRTEISTDGAKTVLPGLPAGGKSADSLLHTNHLTFAADKLTASFQPDTNKVDVFTGEGKVSMTRDDYAALCAKVVYTATNDTVVLTGDPRLETTGVLVTDDEMIKYDHAHGLIKTSRHTHAVYNLPDVALSRINPAARPKLK